MREMLLFTNCGVYVREFGEKGEKDRPATMEDIERLMRNYE